MTFVYPMAGVLPVASVIPVLPMAMPAPPPPGPCPDCEAAKKKEDDDKKKHVREITVYDSDGGHKTILTINQSKEESKSSSDKHKHHCHHSRHRHHAPAAPAYPFYNYYYGSGYYGGGGGCGAHGSHGCAGVVRNDTGKTLLYIDEDDKIRDIAPGDVMPHYSEIKRVHNGEKWTDFNPSRALVRQQDGLCKKCKRKQWRAGRVCWLFKKRGVKAYKRRRSRDSFWGIFWVCFV